MKRHDLKVRIASPQRFGEANFPQPTMAPVNGTFFEPAVYLTYFRQESVVIAGRFSEICASLRS
jgi:hypothetical protein